MHSRIRPQTPRERIDMCHISTTVALDEPQIFLGTDKAFTFDYVFDRDSTQVKIYSECMERLVDSTLHGYNATVLAYGQTGSGKTYTMGTAFDHEYEASDSQILGIIPRAIRHLFRGIEKLKSESPSPDGSSQFELAVQFIELYNEDIFDLLDPFKKDSVFKIHEGLDGQIKVVGASIKHIYQPEDALKYLQQGALARTTASTKMNDQSSRSHAMFTILVRRKRILASTLGSAVDNDLETLSSKFHFVDLAGSERLKRTQATGERAREGISINYGLLALGNCISALGDKSKRAMHVPYRDAKLTRLLQDSLGGNSQTLMIACISPSDRDFMETLNTLKYANRARNIKNKVKLNQDQSSRKISQLYTEIAALKIELFEYKQGKFVMDCEGNPAVSDTVHENRMLLADNQKLMQRVKALQATMSRLTEENAVLKYKLEACAWSGDDSSDLKIPEVTKKLAVKVEELQAKLMESEHLNKQLKAAASHSPRAEPMYDDDTDDWIGIKLHYFVIFTPLFQRMKSLIVQAKKDLEQRRENRMTRSLPGIDNSTQAAGDAQMEDNDSEGKRVIPKQLKSNAHKLLFTEDEQMADEISAVDSNIEFRAKLLEKLQLTHAKMKQLSVQYEEKITVINCQLTNIKKERDDILAKMGSSESPQSKDALKKVKYDYENKISNLQRELKTLQRSEREKMRQAREIKSHEIKINDLKHELKDLKSVKVKLMKKMNEQSNRHKEENNRKAKEIAQLQKEKRQQMNAVNNLTAQVDAKDRVLKRKNAEVSTLLLARRRENALRSKTPSGKASNLRVLSQRWEQLYRYILSAARNRQLVRQLEADLERLISDRDATTVELNACESLGTHKLEVLSQIDSLKANIDFIQENIDHLKNAIMEFEDSKESMQSDTHNIMTILESLSTLPEAKYMLQKFADNSIMMSCNLAIAESDLQENQSELKEAQQETILQQQILQHFMSQNENVHISDLLDSFKANSLASNPNHGSQKSLVSNATYDIVKEDRLVDYEHVELRRHSRSPSPFGFTDA
ncbi:hypothetical protein KR018_000737 [Drosophila ironensis]|nr:hypothetical protein KR018_000737 [Drosophila ironensis]